MTLAKRLRKVLSVVWHVFSARTAPARGAAHQAAVLVGQGDAEPVNLQLRDIRHRDIAEPGGSAQPLVKGPQVGFVISVVQTEHL